MTTTDLIDTGVKFLGMRVLIERRELPAHGHPNATYLRSRFLRTLEPILPDAVMETHNAE